MIRILRRRYPMAKVLLLPVRVQGVEAPPEIAGAIRYANRWKLADLIITGRGGGSMEDLCLLNREAVNGEEYGGYSGYNLTVWPYTRGVVGPMDLTPRLHTAGSVTDGAQLAMNILYRHPVVGTANQDCACIGRALGYLLG